MGAWSHEPFGNDTAADWAYGLENAHDLSYLESAIDGVLQSADPYLDADQCSEAIAAIEVLAKLQGKGTQADVESVDQWVAGMKLLPSAALLHKAQACIDRIRTPDSELLELWEDAGAEEWLGSMAALRTAVAPPA